LAVNFREPLHTTEIRERLSLPEFVEYWECRDSHYELQSGYKCTRSGHVVAGPLPRGREGW
jgi:hypothetical protein